MMVSAMALLLVTPPGPSRRLSPGHRLSTRREDRRGPRRAPLLLVLSRRLSWGGGPRDSPKPALDRSEEKMLHKIVVLLAVLSSALIPQLAQPQTPYALETLLVSSGSDPITSGVASIARFRNSDGRFVEVSAQSEGAWVSYGQYFPKGDLTLVAEGAVFHFQKALGVGVRFDATFQLSESASLGLAYRPGLVFEEPEDWKTENDGVENTESVFHGQLGGVRLRIGPVQLSYYMLNFLDEPWNELPGISYTWAFGDELAASLSATWNNNDEDWLPWLGLTWSPARSEE